jgi:hypothetical protein
MLALDKESNKNPSACPLYLLPAFKQFPTLTIPPKIFKKSSSFVMRLKESSKPCYCFKTLSTYVG